MRWISIINICLALALLLTAGLFFFSLNEEEIPPLCTLPDKRELPKSPFADTDEFFHEIGQGIFALHWAPPQMQLPDLRSELIFNGKNARPDTMSGKASYHLFLKESQERILAKENERVYLIYHGNYSPHTNGHPPEREPITLAHRPLWGDVSPVKKKQQGTPSYAFSPDNQPSPLWLEIKSQSDLAVEIKVSMLGEKGALVASPAELHCFTLQMQPFPKTEIMGWDLGGNRVDTTLLVRQKARWIGPDLFLTMHGGEDFEYCFERERIDFMDGETFYSCFVKEGDFLIWKNGKWTEAGKNEEETENHPLLVVNKIDEKVMSLELWDPEGKGKIFLTLIRSRDSTAFPNMSQEFKFVGAKTWAQFIVESRVSGRMILKPNDWLVLTQDGWIKLESKELIDAYVSSALTGPLFILDKVAKQNGHQVLMGHLFNSSRTEFTEVELAAATNNSLANFYRRIPMSPPIKPSNIQGENDEE